MNHKYIYLYTKRGDLRLPNTCYGYFSRIDNKDNIAHFLGGISKTESDSSLNLLGSLILGKDGCSTIQNKSDTSVTIPSSQKGQRSAVLIIGCNTHTPSIFILSRTAIAGTVFEGTIKASNITINVDGSITVAKPTGLSLYYRLIVMEW